MSSVKTTSRNLLLDIFLVSSLLAPLGISRTLPNEFGVAVGAARFRSGKENQMAQGSVRFDRKFDRSFSLGVLADFTVFICPVCDNAPENALNTISVVGGSRYDFRPFLLQAGIGIGVAKGEKGAMGTDEETIDKFTSVNIPFLSSVLFQHGFQKIGIGIGIELKYHLNFKNNALFASVPIILSF